MQYDPRWQENRLRLYRSKPSLAHLPNSDAKTATLGTRCFNNSVASVTSRSSSTGKLPDILSSDPFQTLRPSAGANPARSSCPEFGSAAYHPFHPFAHTCPCQRRRCATGANTSAESYARG